MGYNLPHTNQHPIVTAMTDLNAAIVQATLKKLQDKFQRETATRQEILRFQVETGLYIPSEFWKKFNIGRGVYKIVNQLSVNNTEPAEVHVIEKPIVKSEFRPMTQKEIDVVSRFNRESLIPTINPNYVEWGNYKMVEKMVSSNKFFTLYVTGESGSGKNEMISHACAKLGRPMIRISITADTKEEHLIGSKTLVDGNIKYEEGPLIWAAENGALVILDEISLGTSSELMCLQNIMEGNPFFVKSLNRVITPKTGFCIVATDNTKGRGSDTGRYMGTNILNDAFLERFMMTMEQGYPTAKVEKEIFTKAMEKHGKVEEDFINQLTNWIHVIRKTYNDDAIDDQITTRRGVHIINTYCMFTNAKTAIELCTNRFDDTTKQAFVILWDKLSAGEKIEGIPTDMDDYL